MEVNMTRCSSCLILDDGNMKGYYLLLCSFLFPKIFSLLKKEIDHFSHGATKIPLPPSLELDIFILILFG